ncbi:SDR family NAD(P)-dependent oxidoreductase [Haladaptatus cibarius]|uniref:SDR family NAD(P)-dependent oxidoreductase n=1 Tax=Haladaptatus cibarius TaxID=453847 RepID=UPI000679AA57|nr:SDR family NAD(P)-dependent oxidoreductase [Haladaptatus cibarius]
MDGDLHESLSGQVALVTGANRGIGAEITKQLTELDATVYAAARTPEDVETSRSRTFPVRLDVTDESTIRTVIGTISEKQGKLDILINNAGVYGETGKLGTLPTGEIDTTLRTNLHRPMILTRHALALLSEQSGARIVNVSSGSGQFSGGGIDVGHLPYGVSKAGLNAFTNSLASQYPGLLVNAVCPGWVRTEMGGSGAPRSVEKGAETPVWLAQFRSGSPSGRLWRDKRLVGW